MAALGLASSNTPSSVSPVYPPLIIFLSGVRLCVHLFLFFFLFRQMHSDETPGSLRPISDLREALRKRDVNLRPVTGWGPPAPGRNIERGAGRRPMRLR